MLMTAPASWLNELAKGTIKTEWGKLMQAKDPAQETSEKVYSRLEPKVGHSVALTFEIAAPLLAERLAIAEYKKKNPRIAPVAPEVLSYQEALELASMEVPGLTTAEKQKVLDLLKTDESMQPLSE